MWHALISDVFELVLEQLAVRELARCTATCAAWRYATTHMRRTLSLHAVAVPPATWPMVRHVASLTLVTRLPDVRHLVSLRTLKVVSSFDNHSYIDTFQLPASLCTLRLHLLRGTREETFQTTLRELTRANATTLQELVIFAREGDGVVFKKPVWRWIARECCRLVRLHVVLPEERYYVSDVKYLARQTSLTHLQLSCTWTPDTLDAYSRSDAAPHLRHLSLPNFKLTHEFVPALERFQSLEVLLCQGAHTVPPVLPRLRAVRLVAYRDTLDTAQLVRVLAASPALTSVHLEAPRMTHEEVAHLVRALPRLRSLHLWRMRALAPLTCLAGARLTHLSLRDCTGPSTDTDLTHLRSPTLRSLDVRGSMVLDKALLARADWPALVVVEC
jgi:hypothetical protein